MNFNKHSALQGAHAFMSASTYHWINYDAEKLISRFRNQQAAAKGTELHDFARRCIELGIKLPRTKQSLNQYVNDAIGYQMQPEQILFYSLNCFGCADAISFKKNLLRIHDFKSGVIPGHLEQLEVYTALFCLEYEEKPGLLDIELRIYQDDDVVVHVPETERIVYIMDKIILFDRLIEKAKEEI